MGPRILVVVVMVALAGCGGSRSLSSAETQAQAEQAARNAAAQAMVAAFEPHLSEYLDPEWTAVPPEAGTIPGERTEMILSEGKLEGNRTGKLVIVNAGTRALHCGFLWTVSGNPSSGLDSPKMATPGMYASVPEKVGTVVLVWSTSVRVGTYTDGAIAYREDYKVRVVNFESREIIDDGYVLGSKPIDRKFSEGDVHGPPPDCFSLDVALRDMPLQATPPAPTPQVYIIKKGDTMSKIAKRFDVTLEALLAANPQIKNPDKTVVGGEIVIPVPTSGEPVPSASGSPQAP